MKSYKLVVAFSTKPLFHASRSPCMFYNVGSGWDTDWSVFRLESSPYLPLRIAFPQYSYSSVCTAFELMHRIILIFEKLFKVYNHVKAEFGPSPLRRPLVGPFIPPCSYSSQGQLIRYNNVQVSGSDARRSSMRRTLPWYVTAHLLYGSRTNDIAAFSTYECE
jgi:hypothetical protein